MKRDVCAWLRERGGDPKVVSRIMVEDFAFTGIGLVDRIGMETGLNLFPLLTVIPSRQRGAARKMAVDCLFTITVDKHELPFTFEGMKLAQSVVDTALQTPEGKEYIALKMEQLEALRESVLGPMTKREQQRLDTLRAQAKEMAKGNVGGKKRKRKAAKK